MTMSRVRLLGTVLLAAVAILACAKPKVVPQNGKQYRVDDRESELFVYVTYHWKGLRYADAIALEEAFVKWAKDRNIFVYAMGRFPTSREWQLGFIATEAPTDKMFQGREISTLSLPAGQWASLHTVEETDRLFFLWKDFAEWLEDDGYQVEKPVFEVYPDIFTVGMMDDAARGEIRYRVSK